MVEFECNTKMCLTHPTSYFEYAQYAGELRMYSKYNLNGICSCGKPYYEHPHFVKENQKRDLEHGKT